MDDRNINVHAGDASQVAVSSTVTELAANSGNGDFKSSASAVGLRGLSRSVDTPYIFSNIPSVSRNVSNLVPLTIRSAFAVIKLTRGLYASVDVADFDRVCGIRWYAHKSNKSHIYAAHSDGRGMTKEITLMHRLLTDAVAGTVIDHRDGDGLNNRRCNIRVTDRFGNAQSTHLRPNHSGYRGVYWHKRARRWRAEVSAYRRRHIIGYFHDAREASLAYEGMAAQLHSEFYHALRDISPESTPASKARKA